MLQLDEPKMEAMVGKLTRALPWSKWVNLFMKYAYFGSWLGL